MTIRERAEQYVALLSEGSEVIEEIDGPVVEEFRHLMPALLYKRGLYLERTARGFIVSSRAPTIAAGRSITWLHVPRLRMVLRGRQELNEVIEALMAAREELLEEPARAFANEGTGDA